MILLGSQNSDRIKSKLCFSASFHGSVTLRKLTVQLPLSELAAYVPLKDNGTAFPAAPAEFENVALSVALAPGARLVRVVPAGKESAPRPPSDALSSVSSPMEMFPPFTKVIVTLYVPVPAVMLYALVAEGPIVTTGVPPVTDGASLTVIISVMGIVTSVGGNAIVPVPLPAPLRAIACAKFTPKVLLGGLLKAALSVSVMVPFGDDPA
jgi:hypothetical protein